MLDLIKSRRSIKKYKDKPVEKELIQKIVEAYEKSEANQREKKVFHSEHTKLSGRKNK